MIKVLIFDFDGLVFDTETYDLESFKLLYSRYEISFPLEQWLVSVGSKLHFNPYEKLITEQPLLRLDDLRKERMEIYKSIIHNQSPRDSVVEYIEEARKHQLQNIKDVADLIGTTNRHVNRILKKWTDEHIIIRLEDSIKIIDFNRLEKISENIRYK